jgi:hypothetical protein
MADTDAEDDDTRPLFDATPPLGDHERHGSRWRHDPVARNCRCHWAIAAVVCGAVTMVLLTCVGVAAAVGRHSTRVDTWDVFSALVLCFLVAYFLITVTFVLRSLHELLEQREEERRRHKRKRALDVEIALHTRHTEEARAAASASAPP